jgi:LysM repeat protein
MQQCPPNTFAYTIVAGDTFYQLARRYGTTTEAIMAANPGVDPRRLQIGQRVCIPGRAPTPTPTCPGGNHYTIRQGDTLYALSRRFGVTLDALMAANPGINPNNLQIGQVICIPTPAPTTCPAGMTAYTIKAGDTFYAIAQRYGITVAALMNANPGVDPNSLLVGQVICIPTAPGTCPAGTTAYTIKAGDTLWALARRYNTTVEAIMAANPGIMPTSLRVGQIICIP